MKTIYKVKRVDQGVKNINELAVSEYLFEGKKKAMLMDTGFGIFNIKKFVNSLTKKELMVVNSHYHPDHSNGNHLFRDVYIGENDVPFKGDLPYDTLVKKVTGAVYDEHPIARIFLKPAVKKVFGTKKGKTTYHPLKDGEVIDLGGKSLTVRALPGHTDGSIVLLDKPRKTIYTGDAVNSATWLFTNPDMKFSTYTNNLRNFYADVKSEGYKTLRCSHTPFPNRLSFIKDYAKFIDSIKPGHELVKFNLPGCDSPLCIKVKFSIKHVIMSSFYFENQIG